jgi:glycosyltransferase involved in cell wall biosynthesis
MSSVLIVDDHKNVGKIENHLMPLADAVNDNTMVCITPNESTTDINYISVPTFGHRLIGIFLLFPYAVVASLRNDYDVIVSVSLFPYGLYALLLKLLFQTPVHHVIIGGDIDSHAEAWYGSVPRRLFRYFDSISVLGTTHRSRLVEFGVPEERVFILTNSVDIETFRPVDQSLSYDFIWIGHFSSVKDPLCFVEALNKYNKRTEEEFRAVMIGDGELWEKTAEKLAECSLSDHVELTGWVKDPAPYYQESSIYVMTSNREAMGLTLIEAMCCGLPVIAPDVGNVSDVVSDQKNGIMLPDTDSESIADAMFELKSDKEFYESASERALSIRTQYSYDNATEDWDRIIQSTVK